MAPCVKVVQDHNDYHHHYDDYCVSVHSSPPFLTRSPWFLASKLTNKTGHSQIQNGPIDMQRGQHPQPGTGRNRPLANPPQHDQLLPERSLLQVGSSTSRARPTGSGRRRAARSFRADVRRFSYLINTAGFRYTHLKSYAGYYNETRTHRSLDKDTPISRPVQRTGSIISHALLGGLHHRYVRV
jgi:hypothetical protein